MDVEFLRYKFEDGHSGIITKHGLRVGVRFIQMIYMFSSAIVMGFIRGNIGVAVLAMNDQTRSNDTYIQIHHWDRRIQGAILSSFFFGYALMLLPAELYFKKIGGKLVFTAMLAVNGALSVAMPTIANKGGWVAVCNAMLFMGTAHAGFNAVNQALLASWLTPSEKKPFSFLVYGAHAGFNAVNQALLASWLTPSEKKPFSFLVYGGMQLGIIIALPLSGLFSHMPLGWELVYYSMAILALSMAVIYGVLTASTPAKHEAIGDKEKEFISEAQSCYSKKLLPRPWLRILKSSQFWAVASAHAASNAVFIFYLVDIPAYLMHYNISLKDSAWFSMLPFMAMWLMNLMTAPTLGWISNLRLISYIFSVTNFRKLINALGAFGIVMGLTLLSNLPTDWLKSTVILLTATLAILGVQFSGFLSSYKDMSENHSGTLMMLGCIISSFVGAVVPFMTGLIIGDDLTDPKRWRTVFITLASFYILCNIMYTVLGSNERQDWDRHGIRKNLLHYNGIIDANQVQLEEFTELQIIQKKKLKQNDIDS